LAKLSIRDLDLKDRRAFIRVDFNVPLKGGVIGDDTRIRSSVPTIRYAIDAGATVILASHLGRPKGKPNPEFSLRPIADRLSEILGVTVVFAEDCVGPAADAAVKSAQNGSRVVLLENLRFHAGEEQNDPEFARALASLADVYVNDAFGAAHRAHASVEAITRFVPRAAAGLLMEQELRYLGHALESPERPFIAILGGAKVSDKLGVLENLLDRVNQLLIGGAMANTFLKAKGGRLGRSLVEEDKLALARSFLKKAELAAVDVLLPRDVVAAAGIKSESGRVVNAMEVPEDLAALDIGPETARGFADAISRAKTIFWNGPMGVFESDPFAAGTLAVAKAIAGTKSLSVVGGGDSVAAIHKTGLADKITHISTGGGASLELLEGKKLPGLAALES
jgi:phosphoglycerate kinase